MKVFARTVCFALAACMVLGAAPAIFAGGEQSDAYTIELSYIESGEEVTHSAALNGEKVPEYDYVWHADPSSDHGEVKNAPAEYYTGTEPSGKDRVYIAHDIYYYPQLPTEGFVKQNYDGEQEWCYYYTAEGLTDRIFATLPVQGSGVPAEMMHSESDAYRNAVLHITQPGTYVLKGEWLGQILIDLGDQDDTFADESAKVTLVLDGVNVKCTVAPALIFYSVYECDNGWEDRDRDSHSKDVDLTDAGARVIIADRSKNTFEGTNVFRMLKTKLKDDSDTSAVPVQKKQRKTDGAFYSYRSMVIEGDSKGSGVLNIFSGYEGLDSELHLEIAGGNINIFSDNDGINVNEDGVSAVRISGGSTHIIAGLGAEGDGIDSNGYLVITGGTVVAMANPRSDSGMDSDFGSYVVGGTVASFGSTMDWAKADGEVGTQAVMNLRFAASQSADEAIIVTDSEGKVLFAYDPDKDEVAGTRIRTYQGAVISSPLMQRGTSCRVYTGGDIDGTEEGGIYAPESVKSFEHAVMQCYTVSDVGGFGGGMGARPDGGAMPEGGTGEMTPPEGFNGMTPPEGGDMPQRPEGGKGERPDGAMPQRPEGDMGGITPPEGGFGGMMPPEGLGGGQTGFVSCMSPTMFELTDSVSSFSGVSDRGEHILTQNADGSYTCSVCQKSFSDSEGKQEIEISTPVTPPADGGESNTPSPSDKESKWGNPKSYLIPTLVFAFGIGGGMAIGGAMNRRGRK